MIETLDDRFAQVAALVPTFAGLHFENGRLIVSVVDLGVSLPQLRSSLAAVLGEDSRFTSAPITLREVRYSFADLYNHWQRLPGVFSIPGVTGIDLDERKNLLDVGIADEGRRELVAQRIRELGIPGELVNIEIQSFDVPTATLTDRLRNVWGGVEIEYPQSECTMGFNTSYSGTGSFATNGHCTSSWGTGSEQTSYWQTTRNVSNDFIGTEYKEATVFTSLLDSRCPAGENCKWHDLALGSYSISQYSIGWLNRPINRVQYKGSITIDASNPILAITAEELNSYIGDTVDKIGRTTGWTYGEVVETCETRPLGSNGVTHYMVCVNLANMGIYGGDSGSAVFVNHGDGNVTLRGQAYGAPSGTCNQSLGYCTQTRFAPWNNIQADFGNLITTVNGQ